MNEQDDGNKDVIAYRMRAMEKQLEEVVRAINKRDSITKSDLNEFKDIIVERVLEVKTSMQHQIDGLKEEKATKESVALLSRIVWWGLGILASTMTALLLMVLRRSFE